MSYFSSKQQQLVWLLLIIWSSGMVFGPYAPQLAEAHISCDVVGIYIKKCVPYLQRGGRLDRGCCTGIKAMSAAAKTTPDRQEVCACLKGLAASIGGINLFRASILPVRCGVFGPYKIIPSTDCSKIRY